YRALVVAAVAGPRIVAFLPIRQEPSGPFRESRELVQQPRPDHLGGVGRRQADHRPDGQHPFPAALDVDDVVVEAVLLRPEPVTVTGAVTVDRRGDITEMLEELGGDVLI